MAKIVTAAVIEDGGRVLLARRAKGQAHAGFWEFPGGKLEAGETEQACLARELFEEFGIRAAVLSHLCDSLYEYDRGAILLRAYRCAVLSGTPVLRVHDRILWAAKEALPGYALTPADRPIAEMLSREGAIS